MLQIQKLVPKALPRILADVKKQTEESQLFLVASGLAYTTLLSLIPAIAVSFSIFKAFGGLERLYEALEPVLIKNLAAPASEEASRAIHSMIENVNAGAVGVTGLVGLLFTSVSLLSSIEKAINKVWKVEIKRSWFQRLSAYWVFITLGPLAAAIALGAAGSREIPLTSLFPSGTGAFLTTIAFFFAVYKWVPSRLVNWRPALVSALFTSTLWHLARIGYTAYARHSVGYGKIYGSLAAVPILLVWLYIAWLVVLAGAALGAALQRRLDL